MSDENSVTIEHPEGAPMRFSKSLMEFLANRKNKAAAFYLGHWLASIQDDHLEQLRVLAKQFMDGVEELYLDDIISVCIHAMAAERRKPQVKLAPSEIQEWVGTLYVASSLDSYRRRGWVQLESTLSIKPHKQVKMSVTELGQKMGNSALQGLH